MSKINYPKAAFISLTLQNGSPIVINAHAIDTIVVFGSNNYSAISTYASKEMEGKYYVVHGSPATIRLAAETAIKNS